MNGWLVWPYIVGIVVWVAACLFLLGTGTYDLRHPRQVDEWGWSKDVDLAVAREDILTGWKHLPLALIWLPVLIFWGLRQLVRQTVRLYRWVMEQVLPVVVEDKNKAPQDKR